MPTLPNFGQSRFAFGDSLDSEDIFRVKNVESDSAIVEIVNGLSVSHHAVDILNKRRFRKHKAFVSLLRSISQGQAITMIL